MLPGRTARHGGANGGKMCLISPCHTYGGDRGCQAWYTYCDQGGT